MEDTNVQNGKVTDRRIAEEAVRKSSQEASGDKYGLVDQLSDAWDTRSSSWSLRPVVALTIVALSGLLSAAFFWEYAGSVFSGFHPDLALVLALLIGLVSNEGAIYYWNGERTSKHDMTASQLWLTTIGFWVAVATSVFGTAVAIIVNVDVTLAMVEGAIPYLMIVALIVPLMAQVVIFSGYKGSERRTVENYRRAQLSARAFDAYHKSEAAIAEARIQRMNKLIEDALRDGKLDDEEVQAINLMAGTHKRLAAEARKYAKGEAPDPS